MSVLLSSTGAIAAHSIYPQPPGAGSKRLRLGKAALAIVKTPARGSRIGPTRARLEQQMKIGAERSSSALAAERSFSYSGRGFELACSSSPCLAIGGDFFDYLESFRRCRLGLVLGKT